MTEREKVCLAVFASICLHALLFGGMVVWAELWPKTLKPPQPSQQEKPLEVTLLPNPTPTPPPPPPLDLAKVAPTPTPSPTPGAVVVPKKIVRSFLDITGLHQTEKAPENAIFESDRNSQAASELPATGDIPLPSQGGKARPFQEFMNTDYSLGKVIPAPIPGSESVSKAPEVSQPKVQDQQELSPELPEPVSTPAPTPRNALALAKPTPVPKPIQPKVNNPQQQPTPVPVQPRLNVPKTSVVPGYQAQREATKIEGSISNRGKAGVSAIGTPLGRYKKAIADAVGSRWYYYINQRMDLITVGDVHIKFYVNEKGRVEGVRILSNTANDTFASYCMQSVTEAQIPQPPPDVLDRLNEGRLEIEYHFTLYPP